MGTYSQNSLDIPKEITEDFEVIDISNTELTDFTTLYLHKLKIEHNISELPGKEDSICF